MKRVAFFVLAVPTLGLLGLLFWNTGPVRGQAADGAKLAVQVRAVLEKRCIECHGTTRTAGLDVRDFKLMLKGNKKGPFVVPRDLKKSRLWVAIESGDMPQDGELPADEKKLVKDWVEAGAPEPAVVVATKRPFVSVKETLTAIRDHLRDAEDEDRPYLRYFVTTNLYNNPSITDEQYGRHLAALSKAINSLHWKKPIVLPRPVDKTGTVFWIDLRDLDWDRKDVHDAFGRPVYEKVDRWTVMLQRYPYGLSYEEAAAPPDIDKIDRDINRMTHKKLVYMRADWFVAFATRSPLYEQILRLPRTAYELEKKLDVNVLKNFRRNRMVRAGYAKSFVSGQNRMVERHDALYGAYWKSYDFKKGGDKSNLNNFPLGPIDFGANGKHDYLDVAFKHDGGEMIFNLPNGLQGYFLTDGKGRYIDRGPVDVVSDDKKTSGTAEIVNGLSCMFCHKNGMIESVKDEVRTGNSVEGPARLKVRRLYVPYPLMMQYVEADKELFLASLKKAIEPFLVGSDKAKKLTEVTEPVGELVAKYYNLDLDLDTAAYELGYENSAELKGAIKGNGKLREIGMGPLANGGKIKREDWDRFDGSSLYQKAALQLDIAAEKKEN